MSANIGAHDAETAGWHSRPTDYRGWHAARIGSPPFTLCETRCMRCCPRPPAAIRCPGGRSNRSTPQAPAPWGTSACACNAGPRGPSWRAPARRSTAPSPRSRAPRSSCSRARIANACASVRHRAAACSTSGGPTRVVLRVVREPRTRRTPLRPPTGAQGRLSFLPGSSTGGRGPDRLGGGPGADRFFGGPGKDRASDLSAAEGDSQDGTVP